VGDLLTEHDVVDVGVSIDMDYPHWTILLPESSDYGKDDSVIPAQSQRPAAGCADIVESHFNDSQAFLEVECIDCNIPEIRHLQAVEWSGSRCHIVRTDETGLGPDLARTQARPASI
jgi:hypothetical protein